MYQIIEDTPALAELPNTKALTIYKEIKGILGQCVLPLSQLPFAKPMMVQVTLAESEMGFKHCLNKKRVSFICPLFGTQLEFISSRCFKKMQNFKKHHGFCS